MQLRLLCTKNKLKEPGSSERRANSVAGDTASTHVDEDGDVVFADPRSIRGRSTMGYKNPEKQKKYQREWRAQRRADWLKDKTCARCGSAEQLEVDHKDPSEKVSHKIWSWSEKRRNEELAKCQVLCKPCHLEKTRRDNEPAHGTNSRYTSPVWRCRCDACREAHRETNAKY